MTMTSVLLPIVGGKFRPPALSILRAISVGTPLHLIPEPTNHVDPNAVKVVVRSDQVKDSDIPALTEELPSGGSSIEEFMEQEEWHLGYIPAKDRSGQNHDAPGVKRIIEAAALATNWQLVATFEQDLKGMPAVRLEGVEV